MASQHNKLELTAGGLRCAAVSDVGMRRTSNQDSMAIALADNALRWQSHGHLLVVADGMGAHAAGELASKMATDTIAHSYHKRHEDNPGESLVEAIREANTVINTKGRDSVDFHGMGTTCSCLLLLPVGAVAAHVGDSRVYRLRGDRLEQLTFDHSLVWEMAAAGHATEEEVPAFVPKNVITRSLGPHPTVSVDLEGPFALQSGDRFLLCSDGLTGPLKPELIGMIVASLPPDEATQSLVDLANLLGGPDNITVLVADVVDDTQLGDFGAAADSCVPAGSIQRSMPRTWQATLANLLLVFGMLGALALGLAGQQLAAAISATSGFGIWLLHWLFRQDGCDSAPDVEVISLQGRAPYRHHQCSPIAKNLEPLNDIVRQLEELESERDWTIDWQRIHSDRAEAHQAIARGAYQEAVVAFCSAVRQLMQALREKEPSTSGDS
ncbi:MAG: protein phosphatase 2C domain-containing protein [Pirellulales bacterium]|nr:protein phosphatase 2C domain-containing protein [Pirellulales bacterium]